MRSHQSPFRTHSDNNYEIKCKLNGNEIIDCKGRQYVHIIYAPLICVVYINNLQMLAKLRIGLTLVPSLALQRE